MKIETKIKIKFIVLLGFFLIFAFLYPVFNISEIEVKGVSFPTEYKILGASTLSIRGSEKRPDPEEISVEIRSQDLESVKAKSYLVFDFKTGDVIVEKNAKERLPVASLTKLMTAWLTYQNLDFREEAKINTDGLIQEKPLLNIQNGELIKVGDLFYAMLVGSANDAAQILANLVEEKTGKNFIIMMNDEAYSLGLVNSSFSNPMGFDSYRNFSSARDLKELVLKTWSLPAFSNLGRLQEYKFSSQSGIDYKINATNKILSKYEDLFAIKTGYTIGSMGSMINQLKNEHVDIGIIVINSPQREKDTEIIRQVIIEQIK